MKSFKNKNIKHVFMLYRLVLYRGWSEGITYMEGYVGRREAWTRRNQNQISPT